MNVIKELFSTPPSAIVTSIVLLLLTAFVVKEIINIIDYYKKRWGIKTIKDSDKEFIEKRIKTLEKHSEWQYSKLNQLSIDILEIKQMVIKSENDRKQDVVASYRSTLYRLHEDFVKQGYVTREGLKTFSEIGKRYENAGGDDIYHEKLYPEVLALQIK